MQPDYATNPVGATDTAAQAALCAGIVRICIYICNTVVIIIISVLLNLTDVYNFFDHYIDYARDVAT